MDSILKSHCETGRFSHGYLLIGDLESSRLSVRKAASLILNYSEETLDSHPDFFERLFDLFTADDSRDLLAKTATKPILTGKKVFSFAISSVATEASPILSKILEESPLTCHFFFLTPFGGNLPLVFRSKLLNVFEEKKYELSEERKIFWEKFLKSGPMERLELSKNAASDKKLALDFLNELEIVLAQHFKEKKRDSARLNKFLSSFEDLKLMRRFLSDKATFPKMIIEHFALTLPQI